MRNGMIIAQISDTHIDLDGPNGAARLRNLEDCVATINSLDPLPDVVIHTGDLTQHGAPAEYEAAKRVLGTLRSPLLVGAGNRDDRAAIRAAFPAEDYLLPDTLFVQYCTDAFPVRLIAVDTLSESSNQGHFCDVRADNLRAALAEDTTKPTVIFMHHPPFEVRESKYPFQFESWESVERMNRALDGQRHVVAAFCGHTHRNAAGEIAEVPVSSMPSVAVDLRLGSYPTELQSTPLYKVHQLDARGRFLSELRPAQRRQALPVGNAC
jgi:3',5'-cyclic AMP phosphodiesterase CpdA